MRCLADGMDLIPPIKARRELLKTHRFLVDEILPHHDGEDAKLYPIVAKLMGGVAATATMSRTHLEKSRPVNLLSRIINDLPSEGPDQEDVHEFKGILYGLHAILSLHFAQEQEPFVAVLDSDRVPESA